MDRAYFPRTGFMLGKHKYETGSRGNQKTIRRRIVCPIQSAKRNMLQFAPYNSPEIDCAGTGVPDL
jgi:hypothetical protein